MTLRPAEGKHQSKSLGELRRLEQLTYQGVTKTAAIYRDMQGYGELGRETNKMGGYFTFY